MEKIKVACVVSFSYYAMKLSMVMKSTISMTCVVMRGFRTMVRDERSAKKAKVQERSTQSERLQKDIF